MLDVTKNDEGEGRGLKNAQNNVFMDISILTYDNAVNIKNCN